MDANVLHKKLLIVKFIEKNQKNYCKKTFLMFYIIYFLKRKPKYLR